MALAHLGSAKVCSSVFRSSEVCSVLAYVVCGSLWLCYLITCSDLLVCVRCCPRMSRRGGPRGPCGLRLPALRADPRRLSRGLAPGGWLARARRPASNAHHHDPLRRLWALLRARGHGDCPQVRIDRASHHVSTRACVGARREARYRVKAESLRLGRRSAAGPNPLASHPGRRPRRGSRGSTPGGAPT